MSVIIEFLKVYNFNTRETGITVPVKLFSDDESAFDFLPFESKIIEYKRYGKLPRRIV